MLSFNSTISMGLSFFGDTLVVCWAGTYYTVPRIRSLYKLVHAGEPIVPLEHVACLPLFTGNMAGDDDFVDVRMRMYTSAKGRITIWARFPTEHKHKSVQSLVGIKAALRSISDAKAMGAAVPAVQGAAGPAVEGAAAPAVQGAAAPAVQGAAAPAVQGDAVPAVVMPKDSDLEDSDLQDSDLEDSDLEDSDSDEELGPPSKRARRMQRFSFCARRAMERALNETIDRFFP
jgi:hypothetical protein